MKLNFIRKIAYVLTSIMLIAAFLLNISLVSVKAAEVSSLPADVGVEVTYDTDNIYLTYEGESFTISRSMLLNSNAPTEYSYPESWAKTCELDHYGYQIPCSYWFSPSEMSIYIMCSSRLAGNSQYKWFYDESYCYKVRSYSDGSFYYTVDNAIYSGKNRVRTYKVDLSDMSSVLYGFITDSNGSSSITVSGYPDDLVCLYSNYDISGFYDSSAVDVCYTPDYYFDYQYLFYVDEVGYTFVDSAAPLVSITNPDPTQALLTFSDLCNKHVYTSVDGVDWLEQYSVSGMYSNNASVNYKWFYDSVGGSFVYILVFSSDVSFEDEPLLTPDYGSITDITNSLYQKNIIIARTSWYKDFGSFSLPTRWETIDWDTFLSYLGDKDMPGLLNYIDGVEEGEEIRKIIESMYDDSLYTNLTDLYMTYYRFNDDGTYQIIEKTSLYGFVYSIYEVLSNIDTRLEFYFIDLHSAIKSVFDNITNTNLYLDKLIGTVKDIDIPDYNYNEKLNDIKQLLFSIDSHITSGGSSSGSTSDSLTGFVPFDDSNIINQLTDINTELDAIKDVSIADTLVGITGMLTQLTDINTDLDAIKATTLADSVTDVFDDFGDDFIDDFGEVIDFVDGAVSGVSGSADGDIAIPVLENTLSFDSQVVSGTVFINTLVMKFWDVMGPMQTVTLLGASFFVLHMVIRKGMF